MKKLSLVINTKNAAELLEKTLKSCQSIADEIVVLDMHSTDKTRKIAKKYKAKVYLHKDLGFADPARNFALSKARGDWILVLDADEEISKKLAEKITKLINSDSKYGAYYLPRKNIIWKKWISHTAWWPDYQLRLFKNGTVKWTDRVHTLPETKEKVAYLEAEEDLAIIHYNYTSVSQYVSRLNRYTDLEIEQRKTSEELNSNRIIKRFFNEFRHRALIKEGFKDGVHGISLSFLQAAYQIVAELKAHEEQLNKRSPIKAEEAIMTLREAIADLHFSIADHYVQNNTGLKRLYWKFRRKYKI
ncbi:MAG: glycosyltransferase family 2 protein [Candidatus Woesebacteria bacterium]|jgi:glycosyltransferase involved in cell wall biosynthesis